MASKNSFINELDNKEEKKSSGKNGRKIKAAEKSDSFAALIAVYKNEKLRRILGVAILMSCVFCLLAMVSYFFSWQSDQSLKLGRAPITGPEQEPIADNIMGQLGAALSHTFINGSFGLATFLLLPFIALVGLRLLNGFSSVSLRKLLSKSLVAVIWSSVALGFLSATVVTDLGLSTDFLGGVVGYETQGWLTDMIGKPGVIMVLAFTILAVLILNYNLGFKFAASSIKAATMAGENPQSAEDISTEELADASVFFDLPEMQETPQSPANGNLSAEEGYTLVVKEDGKLGTEIAAPESQAQPAATHLPSPNNAQNKEGTKPEEKITFTVKAPPIPSIPAPEEQPQHDLTENEHGEIIHKGSLYKYPPLSLLKAHNSGNIPVTAEELEERKNQIVDTLESYSIKIARIEATIGPTVTLYEIVPERGVKISKIKNLEDDIALSLAALGIRIIAPMPGKGTIGIEVPNQHPEMVALKDTLCAPQFVNSTFELPVVLGKTISNEVFVADLTKMPHLLMGGATGKGKSVGINTLLASILFKKHPKDVKFVLVDPKKVELSLYKLIEKHFLPELPDGMEAIITDTNLVVDVLKSLCREMEDRLELLKEAQVRHIREYNQKIQKGQLDATHKHMPYIVLVIDELADLMMTAGKEIEIPIARLAQLARAIGIHLIVATQRPSVNIITGIIKANFPARVAFGVTSRVDSRTILDTGGADQLIGNGDMLYINGNDPIRLQCPFIDTEEVEALTRHIAEQPYPEPFRLKIISEEEGGYSGDDFDGNLDSFFEDAARTVVITQQGSTSMLQRKFQLGYNRAGRIMDQLERAKIVGPSKGSKPREVLYSDEIALEQYLKDYLSR